MDRIHYAILFLDTSTILCTTKNILTKASQILELFLNGAERSLKSVDSANPGNLINLNLKTLTLWLAATVVASLTKEVAGSIPFNDKYFCH